MSHPGLSDGIRVSDVEQSRLVSRSGVRRHREEMGGGLSKRNQTSLGCTFWEGAARAPKGRHDVRLNWTRVDEHL